MATPKEQIARLLEQQPEDSSYDEIVRYGFCSTATIALPI